MRWNPLRSFWNKRTPEQKRRRRRHKRRRRRGARASTADTPGLGAIEKLVVEEIRVDGIAAPVAAPKVKKKKAPPAWLPAAKIATAWIGLSVLPVLASLAARSPWPVDETRTLAVAWEMWSSREFFVPQLNGELYTQQHPLLFWLINLGWSVFGVNEWWPRLLPALFGVASLFLTERLARCLWPGQADIARYAPVLLLAMVFWAFYMTLAIGDLLLVFFTLLGALGAVAMWQGQRRHGWLLLGLALSFGALANGPAIFIYLGPLALLAPVWAGRTPKLRWGRWYGGVTKASLVAVAIGIVWRFALASRAGPEYVGALFSGPLPGPGVDFVDFVSSARPWWWYLAVLPIVTLPWSIFPLVWMRFWYIRREKLNAGMAFCLFWAWPAIVILSLLTVKQPQFLLPILPAFALGMAYLLLHDELVDYGQDSVLSSMAFPIIILGGILAAVPGLPRVEALPAVLWEQRSVFIGMAIAAIGIALAWLPVAEVKQRIMNIAAGGISLLVIAVLGIGSQFNKLYQIEEVATYLSAAQRQQRPIAHVGLYDGQFQFAGRLTVPLEIIDAADVREWSASHPKGLIVTYTSGWQPRVAGFAQPALEAAYRDQRIRLWETRAILAGRS